MATAQESAEKAVDTLVKLMESPDERIRLEAAQTIMSHSR